MQRVDANTWVKILFCCMTVIGYNPSCAKWPLIRHDLPFQATSTVAVTSLKGLRSCFPFNLLYCVWLLITDVQTFNSINILAMWWSHWNDHLCGLQKVDDGAKLLKDLGMVLTIKKLIGISSACFGHSSSDNQQSQKHKFSPLKVHTVITHKVLCCYEFMLRWAGIQ